MVAEIWASVISSFVDQLVALIDYQEITRSIKFFLVWNGAVLETVIGVYRWILHTFVALTALFGCHQRPVTLSSSCYAQGVCTSSLRIRAPASQIVRSRGSVCVRLIVVEISAVFHPVGL